MVKAFPILGHSEFAEACRKLEANACGRLDGTPWLGVTWAEEGVLHIKKQCQVEEKRQRDSEEQTDEDSDFVEPRDEVGTLQPQSARF